MKIAVVIPCYKCRAHILGVLADMPAFVDVIAVVDDACPEATGDWIEKNCHDKRVHVVRHKVNRGVGGAMKTGFSWVLANHHEVEVLVKIDGDGQMDARQIVNLIKPIRNKMADYVKGNRFVSAEHIRQMPRVRLFGNMALSFISKLSTGYWRLMDPTNGFLALHRVALKAINLEKLSDRFFFESDLLFRLSLANAKVVDVPIYSKYGDEKSNLKIGSILFDFMFKHTRNFLKRIAYQYFIMDFSLASMQLVTGLGLTIFGVVFGALKWMDALTTLIPTPTGTIMVVVITIIMGMQFLLSFFSFDIMRQPELPLQWFAVDEGADDNANVFHKKVAR